MSTEKMQQIKSRIAKLENQLKAEQARLSESERKAQNREKYLLGGIMLAIEKRDGFNGDDNFLNNLYLKEIKNKRDREFLTKRRGIVWSDE